MCHSRFFILFFAVLALSWSRADVVINEVVHAASDRVVRWDAEGNPRLGTGHPWYGAAYDDSAWASGPGPFGFGSMTPAAPALGTNTQTRMQYLTPTLYLRKTFTVSAVDAGKVDPVELQVEYNDGFILYVNGREVARRWAGPPKQIWYHDQPAQDPDLANTTDDSLKRVETVNLGAANLRLQEGTNIIAVHALNLAAINTNFLFSGTLRIGGATPVTLVHATDTWRYLPGVVEPSGGLFDPALLNAGRLSVPWGKLSFVDSTWAEGTGPIGQGVGGLGTSLSGISGVTPSLYVRKVFTVTAAQAAESGPLQLLIDYDDSFVAYLNGVEIARANLQTPHTFVPRTAVSTGLRNFGTTTTVTIDPAAGRLQEGANVLAIQVHNVTIPDGDVAIKADLRTASGATVVTNNSAWKYKVGTEEPVVDLDGAIEDNPEEPESVNDWVELHNNGPEPVSLAGWSMSDDDGEPNKWIFPNVTIPAGGYLVVICDGGDITTPGAGGYLHANFSIDADGEYLGLRNAENQVVQQMMLPEGSPFHSFGRNAGGQDVYFDQATPGSPNAGNEFSGKVAPVSFSVPGGFYPTTQSVQLSTATPGATIRYTTDGSEPTATTGSIYGSAIGVSPAGGANGRAIRARAFVPGMIPSDVTTNLYLIGVPAPQNSLPVVSIVGDEQRSLYRPFGIMAIVDAHTSRPGGTQNHYAAGPWSALGNPAFYNNVNFRGRFMERPVNWQLLYPGNAPGFSLDIGLRGAGSPFTRPRYVLVPQNRDTTPNAGAWANNSAEKLSFNFYMRDDLGGDPLEFPIIPGSPVTRHSDFRFRAGHNDMNPFIIDELVRRTHASTGQIGSLGINTTLYVNGVYKGLFNLCQHVREEFLQEAYKSDLDWDVVQVNVPSDGDLIAFQEMFAFIRNIPDTPPNQLTRFSGLAERLDLVNFIDYLITNIYGCTGDWPHNNWIAARERSTTGKWRFYTWDAEGAFGGFGLTVASNNFVTQPVLNAAPSAQSSLISTAPATETLGAAPRVLYTQIRNNPEFKLLFADRIQKHFFNDGGLTNAAIEARKDALRTECQPFISGFNNTRLQEWIHGKGDVLRYTVTRNGNTITSTTNAPSRRSVLFDGFINEDGWGYIPVGAQQGYFVAEGLWPATKAPVFSQHGGPIGANFGLSISNPNGSGAIYYTLNGTDPRAIGGAAVGTPYLGTPIPLERTTTVKARVLQNGQWSPVVEALFVSSSPLPLIVTELMYHPTDFLPPGASDPVDGTEYEFIELKNVGSTSIDLFGLRFTQGIDFQFPPGASVPANGFVVLAKNPAQFALKYPDVEVMGGYGPSTSLADRGETVTLVDAADAVVFSFTYDDRAPWPRDADGNGYSLVSMLPNQNPDPNDSANWRLSGSVNGSPGADDPAPGLPQIQITEVLANSVAPEVDAVELFNPGTSEADLGGWFLSDDLADPKKYRIPDGTIIPAGGYLVLTEAQFNTGPDAFAFNQNGDAALLSSAKPDGTLTGLTEVVTFGASDPGVTFGRHTNSQGKRFFVAQRAPTLGAPNAGPRIGPIILTEIHYHPASGAAEFVEIRNVSNEPVPLFDPDRPQNTWRLAGLEYMFPEGIVLQPRQFLIVSSNEPSSFRSGYGVNAAVTVIGPYAPPGELSNAGERVALQKPGEPFEISGGEVVPFIDVDFVTYGTSAPWPTTTAGLGRSLERANLNGFGDDVQSWKASSSNNGNVGRLGPATFSSWQTQWFAGMPGTVSGPLADADWDGVVNLLEYFSGLNPLEADGASLVSSKLVMDGANGPFLSISYRRSLSLSAGITPTVEASSNLTQWAPGQTQLFGPVVNNGDGSETYTYRDLTPVSDSQQRFLRLKVTQ